MKMTVTMGKQAILRRLGQALAAAQRSDERAARKHLKDQQDAVLRFRAALRDAKAWDYAELEKNHFDVKGRFRVPSPNLRAPNIAKIIKLMLADVRQKINVKSNSELGVILFLTDK